MKHFMDAFAADLLPAGFRKTLAAKTVPALVEAVRRNGAVPMLGHDLRTIADIQQRNANRMRLFQPFNPEFQDYDETNTVVITVERDGVLVACAATRLVWIERSLAEAFQSLSLFYRDVPGMSRSDEICVCTAPTAWTITDCPVAFTGAVFTQQGEDPAIARAMMRLLHLWVYAHWRWSWLTGIAEKAIVRSYAHDVYGYPMAETGVAREGRWYWLLLGPRSFYRRVIADRAFRAIDTPLCLPTEDEVRSAGGRPDSGTLRMNDVGLGA